MRKSLSATVLLLILSCPALAGDMLTPPVAPPPQPVTTSAAPSPADEIPAPADDPAAQDITLDEIAVSILESLLAIL